MIHFWGRSRLSANFVTIPPSHILLSLILPTLSYYFTYRNIWIHYTNYFCIISRPDKRV